MTPKPKTPRQLASEKKKSDAQEAQRQEEAVKTQAKIEGGEWIRGAWGRSPLEDTLVLGPAPLILSFGWASTGGGYHGRVFDTFQSLQKHDEIDQVKRALLEDAEAQLETALSRVKKAKARL